MLGSRDFLYKVRLPGHHLCNLRLTTNRALPHPWNETLRGSQPMRRSAPQILKGGERCLLSNRRPCWLITQRTPVSGVKERFKLIRHRDLQLTFRLRLHKWKSAFCLHGSVVHAMHTCMFLKASKNWAFLLFLDKYILAGGIGSRVEHLSSMCEIPGLSPPTK